MTFSRFVTRIGVQCAVGALFTLPLTAQQSVAQTTPLDRANLDTTCAACSNFYQFANGGWLKHNPIPPAYSQWGSFHELKEHNTNQLRVLLEEAAARRATATDPEQRKLGNFYASCMDTVAIEHAGATPIAPELARIAAIQSRADVVRYLIERQAQGVGLVFDFGSAQDEKNSNEVIGVIGQGSLGLDSRDNYFSTDAHSASLRKAYVAHVANNLVLIGEPRAQADSDALHVLAFETALAGAHRTSVQLRDPALNYNKKTVAELAAFAPGLNWTAFFTAQGVPEIQAINIQDPPLLTTVDSMLEATPVRDWKTYFRIMLVRQAASTLSSAFVDEDFAFDRAMRGVKQQLPREKKCIAATNYRMSEALGKAYVERYFTPEAKARALEMVNNLKAAFRERLATRTWMSDSTRRAAYTKLDAFVDKIGYPDKWTSYATMQITPDNPSENSYYRNVMAALAFQKEDENSRIGRPVDRTRWDMPTPTVNAYYNPAMNEIAFPAGILQPPFFNPNADDAVNYGGIGAVIGHEMTHGFDDQGSQYDAQGNLRNWFTESDLKNFRTKTAAYARQFDTHTILDSVHVNGKLTNGENIADLGGLTIAYHALEKTLARKGRPGKIDGFTPEQRFFLAWAQVWRTNTTPEMARLFISVDPHSPPEWRVNGPLANMPEFAKAWGCKPGDPMVVPPDQRITIW